MRRYQIHLVQSVTAELFVEAESEYIARQYALSCSHDKLVWLPEQKPRILHMEEVAQPDEVAEQHTEQRIVQGAMTDGKLHKHNLFDN